MNKRRPTRLVTTDFKCLCVNDVNRLTSQFRRPMHYPFRGITAHRHHIEIGKQIVELTRAQLTFGLRPFFVCPRCRNRCVKLYSEGLAWYCRKCADLWFESQRQQRRERLKAKAHRIRASLGDHTGQPGDPFPPKRHRQSRRMYRKAISALHKIEHEILSRKIRPKPVRHYRERDREGRYMPAGRHDHRNDPNDLGI